MVLEGLFCTEEVKARMLTDEVRELDWKGMGVTSGPQRHRAHPLGRHGDYSREVTLDSGGLLGSKSGNAGFISFLSHRKEVEMWGLWTQLHHSLRMWFSCGSLGNEAVISEFPFNFKLSWRRITHGHLGWLYCYCMFSLNRVSNPFNMKQISNENQKLGRGHPQILGIYCLSLDVCVYVFWLLGGGPILGK